MASGNSSYWRLRWGYRSGCFFWTMTDNFRPRLVTSSIGSKSDPGFKFKLISSGIMATTKGKLRIIAHCLILRR